MFTLPNLFTLANLVAGTFGIYMTLGYGQEEAVTYVLIGVIFDFLDGFTARKLKKTSPIGRELDSLADLVTFGVLPAFCMFTMIESESLGTDWPFISFLIVVFSALRLAKFNVDNRQSDTFYGLPTPANALLITTLPFIGFAWIENLYVLVAITIFCSLLLVADIKMFALKFKTMSWKSNKWKFIALIFAGLMISWKGLQAVPFLIAGYILFSLFNLLQRKNTK